MVEDSDMRVLNQTNQGGIVSENGGTFTDIPDGQYSTSTQTIGANTYASLSVEGYFDLSGYSLQEKTVFIQSILMQDMGRGPQGSTTANLQRCTIVSLYPLAHGDVNNLDTAGTWILPGQDRSTFGLEKIVQGRYQDFVTLSTYTGVQQVKQSTFGMATATAAQKLYYIDAYLWVSSGTSVIYVPDNALVVPMVFEKEADLSYMMRLQRSVENTS